MRRFRVLDRGRQSRLRVQFPDIDKVLAAEDSEAYQYLAVSVFDHWLDEAEAAQLLADVSQPEQAQRDKRLNRFTACVVDHTEVLNVHLRGRPAKSRPVFRRFLSDTAMQQYMLISPGDISRRRLFRVALPALDALYFESWDDTNVFYLRDPETAQKIRQWADSCGLFCLGHW